MNMYLDYRELIETYWSGIRQAIKLGPCIDLACGDCRRGIKLAKRGAFVICCDKYKDVLQDAEKEAKIHGVPVSIWKKDLEDEDECPLPFEHFGLILVFRYLYRPLFPCIRDALKPGGILIYETFTSEQPKFGKPRNPSFLLKPGELISSFKDWEIMHYFEGVVKDPPRAVAQLVCKKI